MIRFQKPPALHRLAVLLVSAPKVRLGEFEAETAALSGLLAGVWPSETQFHLPRWWLCIMRVLQTAWVLQQTL